MSKNRKFLAFVIALCMVFPLTATLLTVPVAAALDYDRIFRVMDIPTANRPNINMGTNDSGSNDLDGKPTDGNWAIYWDSGGSNQANGSERYMEFTVPDVPSAGKYALDFYWYTRGDSPGYVNARKMAINQTTNEGRQNNNVLVPFTVKTTNAWEYYTCIVDLTAGTNTIRLWFDNTSPTNTWLIMDHMRVRGPGELYIIAATGGNGGVVTGGGEVMESESITVTAMPYTYHTFDGWYENGALVSGDAQYTFTVSQSRTLEAKFKVGNMPLNPNNATEQLMLEWLTVYLKDRGVTTATGTTSNGSSVDTSGQQYAIRGWSDFSSISGSDGNETGFWHAANVYEVLNTAYEMTNDANQKALYKEYMDGYRRRFQSSGFSWPSDGKWVNNDFTDDLLWWANAFTRTYMLTGDEDFLTIGKDIYDRCWLRAWDNNPNSLWNGKYGMTPGGLTWKQRTGTTGTAWPASNGGEEKNIATNLNGALNAARLVQIYERRSDNNGTVTDPRTKEEFDSISEMYAKQAELIYAWSWENLVIDKEVGKLTDNYNITHGRRDWQFSYNYGLFSHAAYELWVNTGDTKYFDHAKLILNYGWNSLTVDDNLTFRDEGGMDGGDGAAFRLVLARATGRIAQDKDFEEFKVYLLANAYQAYHNRREKDGLIGSELLIAPNDNIKIHSAVAAFAPTLMWYSGFDPNVTYGFEDNLKWVPKWGESGIYLAQFATRANVNFGHSDSNLGAPATGSLGKHSVFWDEGGAGDWGANPLGESNFIEWEIEVEKAGLYQLDFRWYTREDNFRFMKINDGEKIRLDFKSKLGGGNPDDKNNWAWEDNTCFAELEQGKNTIRIWYDGSVSDRNKLERWLFIDYLKVTPATATAITINISSQPKGSTVFVKAAPNPMAVTAQIYVGGVESSATNATLSYQWQVRADGTSWSDISGETNSTLSLEVPTEAGNTQYRVIVSGICNGITLTPVPSEIAIVTAIDIKAEEVRLNKPNLLLNVNEVNETEQLTATISPANATNKDVTWTSSNPNVATVDNGLVTAVGAGEATITVTTNDGGHTAECVVTVVDFSEEQLKDATQPVLTNVLSKVNEILENTSTELDFDSDVNTGIDGMKALVSKIADTLVGEEEEPDAEIPDKVITEVAKEIVTAVKNDDFIEQITNGSELKDHNTLGLVESLETDIKKLLKIDNTITVSEDLHDKLDVTNNLVKAAGAILNLTIDDINNAETTQSKVEVNLTISPSDDADDIQASLPEDEYTNSVVVNIELKINDEPVKGKLAVPITITMPIPTGMESSDNILILHYKDSTSSYEKITPKVDGNNIIFTVKHFSDFAIVKYEVTAAEVDTLLLSSASNNLDWDKIKNNNTLASSVTTNLNLITNLDGHDATISWSSNKPNIIASNGKITRPINNTEVTLTATITVGKQFVKKTFPINVIGTGTVSPPPGGGIIIGNQPGGTQNLEIYVPSVTETPVPLAVDDKPVVQINDIDIDYTIDKNNNIELIPTQAQMKKVIENAQNGVLTVDTGTLTTVNSIKFEFNTSWISAKIESINLFNKFIGSYEVNYKTLSKLKGKIALVIKKGSLMTDILVNGKSVSITDYANPMIISIPYVLKSGESASQMVMMNKTTDTIIPRSYYKDGYVYATVYSAGHFEPACVKPKKFTDTAGTWSNESVKYMNTHGVVNGTAESTFEPNAKVTRAQYISMLIRLLDMTGIDYSKTEPFADIDPKDLYYPVIMQARTLGITNGVGDNNFGRDLPITLEDMYTMTYRAMKQFGMANEFDKTKELDSYLDGDEVSPYAVEAMQNLLQNGIVNSDGSLNPKVTASRAITALLMYRLLLSDK